jgi:hypothetical protein
MTKAKTVMGRKVQVRKANRVDKTTADPPKKRQWVKRSSAQKEVEAIYKKASKAARDSALGMFWAAMDDPSEQRLRELVNGIKEYYRVHQEKVRVLGNVPLRGDSGKP